MKLSLRCLWAGLPALAAALFLSAGTAFAGSIVVEDAWSRATPAGAKVGVGFATIKNEGGVADRLVSAASPIAAHAEIHEMKMDGDMMKMRPVPDGVAVPPDGEVALAPSGYHLMFTGLAAPLKEGETFKATLTFEHAGAVEVTFDVKALGAPAPQDHMHH